MLEYVSPSPLPEFTFPTSMYYLARFFHNHPQFNLKLSQKETKLLQKKINKIIIDRPIYIMGLARSGTTVLTELVGKHPDVAYFKYLHAINPFIPHWMQNVANVIPIFKKPVERLHKDRLMVNRDSPEAVEEVFWMFFFESVHNDKLSNIFDSTTMNPDFEKLYKNCIRKLMHNQRSLRYVTKNNYGVSRLEYLQKLFPDLRVILLIRNPVNHIASLIKQDVILSILENEDKRLLHWTKMIGHREFGTAKVCINVGNTEIVNQIHALWNNQETYAKGWAIYWNSIYEYLDKLLNNNEKLKKQTLILKYEDITENSEKSIDKIVSHCEINSQRFEQLKIEYIEKLKQPDYYEPVFTDEELESIKETTQTTAQKFGYF